jgi:hypothetical protein
MILRVTIENLFSFKEETEISFVAGKSDLLPHHVRRAEKRDDISVLKAGIIYGANASGKSNIIKAISILKTIALGRVPQYDFEPFKLSNLNKPSMVKLEVKIGKHYYEYGAKFTNKEISEEWLYEFNVRKDVEIFSRINNNNDIHFGIKFKDKENEMLAFLISKSTPASYSFLSEYVKRNGKTITAIVDVYTWMKSNLKFIFPSTKFRELSIRVEKDKTFAYATKSLLNYFNTGIVDIRRIKVSKESVDLPETMLKKIMREIEPGMRVGVASDSVNASIYFIEIDKTGTPVFYKQFTIHQAQDNKDVTFGMNEESDGSLRIMDFIPMLIDLRLNDVVYLIDEIDRSMHPMLSQKILEYYFQHLEEKKDTQLIFSTHESNLLDLNLIRADEVWFVEKDKNGESHLTSLAEYKPREDIRKGYLQGRYGAIPFFAPINSLNW